MNSHKTFQELIQNSSKILILGHAGPDPDAVSSVLLARGFVLGKYPDKDITCSVDGNWGKYAEGLVGIETLHNIDPYTYIQEDVFDLIILVDANDPTRFSLLHSAEFGEYLTQQASKVVCIDHHQTSANEPEYACVYNIQASNAAEEVFDTFTEMGFAVFKGAYELVMLGMVSDTGRFLYANSYPQRTFGIAAFALGSGISIESVASRLEHYTYPQLQVTAALMKNVTVEDGYNFGYLSDDDVEKLWELCGGDSNIFSVGTHVVINQFLKSVEPNRYGVVVYKDMKRPNFYKGSLRSLNGAYDCNKAAEQLGGGGHKNAAGFGFEAASLEEAKQRVLSIVSK
jgi:nanoRNase/pAp phosphatase (c-di-AMP/oligoRNAs hydrolase)